MYLVLGVAALGWGGAVWRWVRVASGLFLGAFVGAQVGVLAHDARVGLVAGAVLAIGSAILFYIVERAAVAALGSAVAVLVAQVAWPLVQHGQGVTAVGQGVAGLVGLVLGAFLHQPVIKAVTALFGAFLTCQALGFGDRLQVVLGLAAAGWAWQMWGGSRGGGPSPGRKAKKKKDA